MEQTISPKQLARAIGVSESSIKRWCDQGKLSAVRTAGGHRRIPVVSAIDYVRRSGRSLLKPELLKLPGLRQNLPQLSAYTAPLLERLLVADEVGARQICMELCISHHSLTVVFDEVIDPLIDKLEFQAAAGKIDEYQASRAKSFLSALLAEVRATVNCRENLITAVGATVRGDHDSLRTLLVELSLRQAGWNATSLGTSLSIPALQQAARALKPRMIWLMTSDFRVEAELANAVQAVGSIVSPYNGTVAVCGSAKRMSSIQSLNYSWLRVCDSYSQIVNVPNLK